MKRVGSRPPRRDLLTSPEIGALRCRHRITGDRGTRSEPGFRLAAGFAIQPREHRFDLLQEVGQISDDRRFDHPLVDLVIGMCGDRSHPRDLLPGNSRIGRPDLVGHMAQVLGDRLNQVREPRAVDGVRGPLLPEAGPPLDRLDRVLLGLLEVPTRAACHRASPYPVPWSE